MGLLAAKLLCSTPFPDFPAELSFKKIPFLRIYTMESRTPFTGKAIFKGPDQSEKPN